jgi:hypothetical protein
MRTGRPVSAALARPLPAGGPLPVPVAARGKCLLEAVTADSDGDARFKKNLNPWPGPFANLNPASELARRPAPELSLGPPHIQLEIQV